MTLSALGIFSAAGAGGLGAYELISTTILGSTAASVDLTGLSSYSTTYKHLQIRYSAKDTTTGRQGNIRFNGITTTSYARHTLRANASTVSSTQASSLTSITMPDSTQGSTNANAFAGGVIDILDAYSTTKNKTVRALYGIEDGGSGYITLLSGLFNSTAATDSIQLNAPSTFAIGTRVSIYGIKG
jgi:hypothetical protein